MWRGRAARIRCTRSANELYQFANNCCSYVNSQSVAPLAFSRACHANSPYTILELRARKTMEGGKEGKSSRPVETSTAKQRRGGRIGERIQRGREYRTIVYQRLKQTHRRRWLWSAGLIYRVRRPRPRPNGILSTPRNKPPRELIPVKSLIYGGGEEALRPFYGRDFGSRAKHVPRRRYGG